MKKKIFLSILVVIGLFTITGCGEKNNSNTGSSTDIKVNDNNQKQSGYWYIGKTLTLQSGASNDGAKVTFSLPDENGKPTKVTIRGGSNVDGNSIDGTYSLNLSECDGETVYGLMIGGNDSKVSGLMAGSIKGKLISDSDKYIYVDLSL